MNLGAKRSLTFHADETVGKLYSLLSLPSEVDRSGRLFLPNNKGESYVISSIHSVVHSYGYIVLDHLAPAVAGVRCVRYLHHLDVASLHPCCYHLIRSYNGPS